MSINAALSNALSGLRVTTKLTETTSNNLANALTDGYARQEVHISSVALNGQGTGVRVVAVNRASAPEYTSARRQADADASQAIPIAEALSRIGQVLGEADGDDGLFIRVQDFEARLRDLAETPEAAPRQTAAVEAAGDIASVLNRLNSMAAVVRQDADAAIDVEVQAVNRNLGLIEDLNAKIQFLATGGRSVATLVDERERLIDEVSATIPVRTQQQPNGSLHLYTTEGVFLLQEHAKTVEFTRTPLITAPMAFAPGGAGALSGLFVDGQEITPNGGTRFAIGNGSLAGQFAVRDEVGVTFQSRIDRFAADLIARFEDPAVDPTLAAGDPGLFTDAGGVLDLSVVEGLAGRLSVNALVDPAQGGEPSRLRDGLQSAVAGPASSDTILRNLLTATRTPQNAAAVPGLTGFLGATELAAAIVDVTAITRTSAETEASRQSAARSVLAEAEADRIGVDQDAEMASLIQIEQAYSANARIIQAVSRMMQELTELR